MADAILYFTGVCIHISSELQQVQSSEINIMTYDMVVYDQSRENARTCKSASRNPNLEQLSGWNRMVCLEAVFIMC